jgi:Flp pilus assembly pilin Flp
MLQQFVSIQTWVAMVGRRVREEQAGLTAIEYGVFAAFIVLAIVLAAVTIGPKLTLWLTRTMDCIMEGRQC